MIVTREEDPAECTSAVYSYDITSRPISVGCAPRSCIPEPLIVGLNLCGWLTANSSLKSELGEKANVTSLAKDHVEDCPAPPVIC